MPLSVVKLYKDILLSFKIQVFLFCALIFFIYACNATNPKDHSTMSNNNKLLEKGDEAPQFTADTYHGTRISLTQLLKSGPVVLVFIRGFS